MLDQLEILTILQFFFFFLSQILTMILLYLININLILAKFFDYYCTRYINNVLLSVIKVPEVFRYYTYFNRFFGVFLTRTNHLHNFLCCSYLLFNELI